MMLCQPGGGGTVQYVIIPLSLLMDSVSISMMHCVGWREACFRLTSMFWDFLSGVLSMNNCYLFL